ncbi:SAM-dependent methyltransferase [Marinibacterium profundimaris]|uniref:Cyclopropane-fatty-acyl-phospholipid synthase n=1 Tax=Marinibacterium profundimaris TaxID=1679460 RepID=A0A225NBI9_9RHOB|nr:cyclopropane-fatty-acyl-phospholipid synthase family protein [Marinibacterium profundimaris]OWU67865.1 cyclopropane-fatty-acyl-phospholipid synthase [Marinibacterium profundimaris]
MWEKIFDTMLGRLIQVGKLAITYPDGTLRTYGPGGGIETAARFTRTEALRAICLNPELGLGETYMDATFVPDDLDSFLRLVIRNRRPEAMPAWVNWLDKGMFAVRHWMQRNTATKSKSNVAHHYDLSDDLYRLFLDADMQYSCAYFARPGLTLEQAQAAKKAHIAAKLALEPGMSVLDIGCGWGGMALTLARDYGVQVTGVTLSENQLATARARAAAEGLSDRVSFRLQDYREITEQFDRVVSVGMLEHVGVPHYAEYFDQISAVLKHDGVALVHTIGRCAPPTTPSPWFDRYIFPGGYIPSLSELAAPVENAGLWSADLEVLRLHYALTIREWQTRFRANLDTVREMYDERFIRMWDYYLIACIMAFEEQPHAVFQLQLTKSVNALPLTRDYLYRAPAQPRAVAAAE